MALLIAFLCLASAIFVANIFGDSLRTLIRFNYQGDLLGLVLVLSLAGIVASFITQVLLVDFLEQRGWERWRKEEIVLTMVPGSFFAITTITLLALIGASSGGTTWWLSALFILGIPTMFVHYRERWQLWGKT